VAYVCETSMLTPSDCRGAVNGFAELLDDNECVRHKETNTRLTEVQKYSPSHGSTSRAIRGRSKDPRKVCERQEELGASDIMSKDDVNSSVSCVGIDNH
jgi:hypothetical protein